MRKLVLTLLAVTAVPLQAQDLERWDLTAPRVSLRLNAGLLRSLGITATPARRADGDGYVAYDIGASGRLVARAPGSVFRTVDLGELQLRTALGFAWKDGGVALRDARLSPGAEPSTFVVTAADGTPLFSADHQHFAVDREAGRLRLYNLDLRLTPELAARLGDPRHQGLAVGALEIQATAGIPKGAEETQLGACVTPDWGAPSNDVGLIAVSSVSQVALGGGVVAIAPSAVLKNVGSTDVPWRVKFSAPGPPYDNDQHPFLVWNMYRVADGALRQIGASGLKHAFTTVNSNCDCAGGNILWVTCEDTYGVSTNNSTNSLGPRSEVTAHTGVWQRCGSVFDPDCNGVQNPVPGFSGASDSRRLNVLETDLTTPGAQYYFDSWYVVRDDVNIFNTMGHRQVGPSFGGSWSFSLMTALTPGAVIDAWVNPTTPGPNADWERLDTGEGRLTLAVRATDLGAGQWRYDYALMNHDFDRKISGFSVPLPNGAAVTGATFHDVDRNPATDWQVAVEDDQIAWRVAKNGSRQTIAASAQDWGLLYSFRFQTDAAPSAAGALTARLQILEAPGGEVTMPILGPAAP